jgi:hypothetical protein
MKIKCPLGKNKLPWSWLIFIVVATGFLLRLSFVLGRAAWTDEVFYFSVANFHSWDAILAGRYNLAGDNPPFFLIFLQAWSLLGKSVLWLRLSGLIGFLASTFLLLLIFKNTSWKVKLIIVSLFSFSPFFIHLNFWISPYNLILPLSLLQFYLTLGFAQGAYDAKRKLFVTAFTFINLLLFNIHYSAVYTFSLYPVLFLYLLKTNRDRARIFLISSGVSALCLVPSVIILYDKWALASYFLKVNTVSIDIPSVFHFFVYIFDKSILRLGQMPTSFVFVSAIGILVYLASLSGRKSEASRLWLIVFLGIFVLPAFFLYLFYPAFPSILVERGFLTFHLGFYFLVAYTLDRLEAHKARLFVFLFFLGILLTSVVSARLNWIKARLLLPGDVTRDALVESDDYQRFLKEVNSELEKEGKWLIMFLGDDAGNRYARSIFLGYYFLFSPELKEIRTQYGDRIDFLSTKIKRGEPSRGYNILLINIDKEAVKKEQLKLEEQEHGIRPVVIDYWSFFPDQKDK